jgi:uncharacterized protein YchJ
MRSRAQMTAMVAAALGPLMDNAAEMSRQHELNERATRFGKRRAELEEQGYVYVGQGKVRANAPCPCKSGQKFKRCCVSRVVRAGGGTFVKGVADLTGIAKAEEG